jgi:hypothetical protein
MHGYDVVTSDDHKVGQVVDERNDCLIVEHGHVFKSNHAIPRAFVHVDDDGKTVRATVTKDIFVDSPKVTDDWDCNATLEHYGLVGGLADPDTEGYGETLRTDPAVAAPDAVTAQRAAMRAGTGTGAADVPHVRERSPNAFDPAGDTANLS